MDRGFAPDITRREGEITRSRGVSAVDSLVTIFFAIGSSQDRSPPQQ
jgi:hypothetical protein